ncbi:MAG TPA: hypothetical protein VHZ78_08845 [Rhizomicrobium sp.]|jgi:hypothetical protein|nr:hypothetical protein [Rhizomicrobium sp.]
MTVRITAWKKTIDGLLACEPGDILAVAWDVRYPGSFFGMPLQFEDRHQAERIAHALSVAFRAGGEAKLRELRQFIGILP